MEKKLPDPYESRTSVDQLEGGCNIPTLEGLVMQQVTNYLSEYFELSL